jgi:hypothetical protein
VTTRFDYVMLSVGAFSTYAFESTTRIDLRIELLISGPDIQV